jgi:lysophospholipase L1-like esterase
MKMSIGLKRWWNVFSGMIRAATGDPNAWESSVLQFESEDKRTPVPPNAIVFIGSSTFTFWETLRKDMSPLQVINRGFGGSKIADMSRYIDRIVLPYAPKAVVVFAGTNDISGRKPATAEQVFQGYLAFVGRARNALPNAHIYYVAITPTLSRWKYWPIASDANRRIKEHAEKADGLHFIDPTTSFLGPDGKPMRKLFRADRLHPNAEGYAVLTKAIKPILEADLGRLGTS